MRALAIRYENGAVFLPRLGLWLDSHEPQFGPEKVFVSHAHSDHIGFHREVILTEPTARFMQARLHGSFKGDSLTPDGGEGAPRAIEHRLRFGERRRFQGPESSFDITLLPAGHIFGSAMSLIEAEGESLLYTGDFKLRRGLSAEACEPRKADFLIMETTYGRPEYRFPPTEEVIAGVVRFCREALDNDETAVL